MMGKRWGGSASRSARAICGRLVAAGVPCLRCGRPILPGEVWHADHIIDRAMGGSDAADNLWPAHERCNTSAGGKRGAQIVNAWRAEQRERAAAQPALFQVEAIRAEQVPPATARGIRGV